MEIESSRLLLREFALSDVDEMHRWRCAPQYLEHYPADAFDRDHTVGLVRRFVEWQAEIPRWRRQLAFVRRDTAELIGSGGIRKTSVDADTADVGYELDPRHWGQGFATEGMAQLAAFALEEVGLRLLTARAVCSNRRSHRVLERLGFECVETIPPGPGKDGVDWPERYEFHLRAPEG